MRPTPSSCPPALVSSLSTHTFSLPPFFCPPVLPLRLPPVYFAVPMESPHRADLFDPATLATLGHIEVVARWIVDGFLSGLHRSPRKGFSVALADFRPYQPGDDLRYVGWQIAARSD